MPFVPRVADRFSRPRPPPRQTRVLALLAATVAAIAFTQPLPRTTDIVASRLETRFALPADTELGDCKGLIVLGGGEARLREAGQLARRHGIPRIFVSGAGELEYVRSIVGIDLADRIEIENRSRNTFENAIFTKLALEPARGQRWLLVTSAYHLPRAVGAFRKAGIDVLPYPVYRSGADEPDHPTVVWHEAVGLVWYWLRGRTSALVPA